MVGSTPSVLKTISIRCDSAYGGRGQRVHAERAELAGASALDGRRDFLRSGRRVGDVTLRPHRIAQGRHLAGSGSWSIIKDRE